MSLVVVPRTHEGSCGAELRLPEPVFGVPLQKRDTVEHSPDIVPRANGYEDEPDLQERWSRLQRWTLRRFGKKADVEGLLFLIGIQELGQGVLPDLGKTRKEQIVREGAYCVLETLGYYERVGMEKSGHWIWQQAHPMPAELSKEAEEVMLRRAVLRYFDRNLKHWPDES